MANGDIISVGADELIVKMFDAQSASASSPWIHVKDYPEKNFHADAIETGGQIEIMVRNDENQPLAATDGVIAQTVVPAALAADVTGYIWAKAKKTAGGTPAPSTLIMMARRR